MGHVYLLCELSDTEKYKIGVTKREISKRVAELRTGNPNKIIIINSYTSEHYHKIESWLHRENSQYKETEGGTEWFNLPNEVVFSFEARCKDIESKIKLLIEHNPFYK